MEKPGFSQSNGKTGAELLSATDTDPANDDATVNRLLEASIGYPPGDKVRTARLASDPPIDPGHVHEFGTTVASYKDAQIDNVLSFSQAMNLKIADVPNGCDIRPWKDDIGYYFTFSDGKDGEKRHYIPDTVQFVQVVHESGKREVYTMYQIKQGIDAAMRKKP